MKKLIYSILVVSLVLCNACSKDNDNSDSNSGDGTSATVTDIDGNVYHTVKIGAQTWMVENLKTTKYNDGTVIPIISYDLDWNNTSTPAYCWYDNNTSASIKTTYGALYNWYAVNTGKLAPKGWHIPTDAEWTSLVNYLIAHGYNYAGLQSGNYVGKCLASTANWTFYGKAGDVGNDLTTNNSTGFTAQPGGYRWYKGFYDLGNIGYWWSSTEKIAESAAICKQLHTGGVGLYDGTESESDGLSVRCLKD